MGESEKEKARGALSGNLKSGETDFHLQILLDIWHTLTFSTKGGKGHSKWTVEGRRFAESFSK